MIPKFVLLDALRGTAILMVLLLHFSERGCGSGDTFVHARVWWALKHGYLGVQLFFVISGYCITAAVYASFQRSPSVAVFLARRCRRIFPPYWASIVLVVAMGCATIGILDTPVGTVFPLAPWEWIANALLLQGPLQAKDANLVYWSLSVELQFYGLLAVCLRIGRLSCELWLLILTATASLLHATHALPLTGWVLNYWHEFACGIAAFYWISGLNRWRMTPWVLAGLTALTAWCSYAETESLLQSDGRLVLGMRVAFSLGVMLLLVAAHPYDTKLTSLPVSRVLSAIGTISYSLYLTHVPIGTRIFNLGERLTGLSGIRWVGYFLASMTVTLGFGAIFYRWCERPWLHPRPPHAPFVTPVARPESATAAIESR